MYILDLSTGFVFCRYKRVITGVKTRHLEIIGTKEQKKVITNHIAIESGRNPEL